MGVPAVGLHDEVVRWEVEVGLEVWVVGGVEGVVADRCRQAVVARELAHAGFELAAGELGVGCDCVGESRGASVPVGSRDDVFDRSVVVELQAFGLREGPFEMVVGDLRRDVEERAVDRRGRDALVVSGVLGIEGTRTVQADPGTPRRDAGAVTSGRGAS